MNKLEMLIDRLQVARTWTKGLLTDVEESRWFDPPAPGVGHVAWQVGHLASSQVALIHVRCFGREYTQHAPERFRQTFGKGSTPVADPTAYPPISEIRRMFDQLHRESIDLIRGMTDAELDEPTLGEAHPMFTTKAGAIGTAAIHETFHGGQIALIRRLAGKKPLR